MPNFVKMEWRCITCDIWLNKRDKMIHQKDTDHEFTETGRIVRPEAEPNNMLTDLADEINSRPTPRYDAFDRITKPVKARNQYPNTYRLFDYLRGKYDRTI